MQSKNTSGLSFQFCRLCDCKILSHTMKTSNRTLSGKRSVLIAPPPPCVLSWPPATWSHSSQRTEMTTNPWILKGTVGSRHQGGLGQPPSAQALSSSHKTWQGLPRSYSQPPVCTDLTQHDADVIQILCCPCTWSVQKRFLMFSVCSWLDQRMWNVCAKRLPFCAVPR